MKKTWKLLLFLAFAAAALALFCCSAAAVNESENNNSYGNANAVSVNTTVNGYLSDSDNDYFSFTLSNPGTVSITFNHTAKVSTQTFARIYLLKYSGSSRSNYYYIDNSCDTATYTTIRLGLPAGTYYFQVDENYGFNQNGNQNVPYNFKINYQASDAWEKEKNNEQGSADVIQTGKTVYGSLLNSEYDYYAFNLPADATVTVALNHTARSSTATFARLYLLKYTGSSRSNIKYIDVSCDKATTRIENVGLTAGTYYVEVEEYYAWDQFGTAAEYSLQVLVNGQTIPTAAKLSSLTLLSAPDKTAYAIGEPFDSTGLRVRANYSDGTVADVSGSVTLSGFDSSAAGKKTVTVSYTDNGVTKTTSFTVQVNASGEAPADAGRFLAILRQIANATVKIFTGALPYLLSLFRILLQPFMKG